MATTTPVRGMDANQWIDRDTAAALMGCSGDTVRRVQRDNDLPTSTGPNNTTLLRLGDLIALNRIPASVLDPQISAREVAEAINLRKELNELQRKYAVLEGTLDSSQQTVTMLQAHLATQAAFIADLRAERTGKVA